MRIATILATSACAPGPSNRAPATPLASPFVSPALEVAPSLRALGIDEASAVVRSGDRLLLVGDDEHGVVFDLPLAREETRGSRAVRRIPIDPLRLRRVPFGHSDAARDLEGIGVLADGRTVVLSERRRALFDESGPVVEYGGSLGEFGGRGLEGLAVRALGSDSSRVAVLWEGGYPETRAIPPPLRERNADRSLTPCVFVHDLAAGERNTFVPDTEALPIVVLRIPLHPGNEPAVQRFRAPDLVWCPLRAGEGTPPARGGAPAWGFLVLLSSSPGADPAPGSPEECGVLENGVPRRYCYKWLQRFEADGAPYGKPYDLDDALPRELQTANWEGIGWFEPGESLALVYDESPENRRVDPQDVVVIPLPPGW